MYNGRRIEIDDINMHTQIQDRWNKRLSSTFSAFSLSFLSERTFLAGSQWSWIGMALIESTSSFLVPHLWGQSSQMAWWQRNGKRIEWATLPEASENPMAFLRICSDTQSHYYAIITLLQLLNLAKNTGRMSF